MTKAASEAHPFLWTLLRMYGLYFGILIILAIAACLVYVAVETFGKSTKKNRHG